MSTPEQLAFNIFWNSMDEREGMDMELCENVFKDGYNAGRKQALEIVINCINSDRGRYNPDNLILVIKESLK